MRGKLPRGEMMTPKKELASKNFYEALAKLHYLQAAANCIEAIGNQAEDICLRNIGENMFNLIEEIMEALDMVRYHVGGGIDFHQRGEPGTEVELELSNIVRHHTANLSALMENAPGKCFEPDRRTLGEKTIDLTRLGENIRG